MLSSRRSADSRFYCVAALAFCALIAPAIAATDSTISIMTQQHIQAGDAVKFQWQGGKPPYTLKVLLNNSVVAQNEGWTGTSVQWRATPEQVPAGTEIKVRITDSRGEMVLSDATKVVATGSSGGGGRSSEGKGGQSQQQHQGQYDDREGDDDFSSGNAQHMDDPSGSNRYSDEGQGGLEAPPTVPTRRPGADTGRGILPTQVATEHASAGPDATLPAGASEGLDSDIPTTPTGIDHAGAAAMASAAMPSASAATGMSAQADSVAATLPTTDAVLSGASDTSLTSAVATSASDPSAAAASSSATSDSTASSESGSSNKTIYLGIGVVVVLLVGAGLAFFFWRRNKQRKDEEADAEKAASRKRKGKGKASLRGQTAAGSATDSQGDDEEKLVGGSDDGHDAYGSDASDEETPQSSSKKGSTRSGGRGSQAYHDDDGGGSEGLESDGQAPVRRSKGMR